MASKSPGYLEILTTELEAALPNLAEPGGYIVEYPCGHTSRRFPILAESDEDVYTDYHLGIHLYKAAMLRKYREMWANQARRYGKPKKVCPLCRDAELREEFPEMFRIIDWHEDHFPGVVNSFTRVKRTHGYVALAKNAVRLRHASRFTGEDLLSTQQLLIGAAATIYREWENMGWKASTHDFRWLDKLDRLQEIYVSSRHNTQHALVHTLVTSNVLTRISPDLYGVISGCALSYPAEGLIRSCAVSLGKFPKLRQKLSSTLIYSVAGTSLGIVKFLGYMLEEGIVDPAIHLSGPLGGLALAKFGGIWPQMKQELIDLDFDPQSPPL